jgi:hypothetical protein
MKLNEKLEPIFKARLVACGYSQIKLMVSTIMKRFHAPILDSGSIYSVISKKI